MGGIGGIVAPEWRYRVLTANLAQKFGDNAGSGRIIAPQWRYRVLTANLAKSLAGIAPIWRNTLQTVHSNANLAQALGG